MRVSVASFVAILLTALTSCGLVQLQDPEDTRTKTIVPKSRAMEPALPVDEEVTVRLVDAYEPERGDVIVFDAPDDWLGPEDSGAMVKRVIGVPGDVITCCEPDSGWLAVNGRALDESGYVMQDGTECAAPGSAQGQCQLDVGPIPDGYLFVMGDNRWNSADSSAMVCQDPRSDCPPEQGLVPVDLVWAVKPD